MPAPVTIARLVPRLRLARLHRATDTHIPHWRSTATLQRWRRRCQAAPQVKPARRAYHSTLQYHQASSSHTSTPTITSCCQCQQPLASNSTTTAPAATIFCSSCKSLQPPPDDQSSLNIYQLFNIPPSFTVDRKSLDTAYRQYQRQLHPDRFGQQSQQVQQYSADWSSMINAAYSTLCDSYLRAIYLLAMNGVDWEKQPSTLTSSSELMEVMELREEIDEAGASKDWAKLDALQSTNNDKMLAIEQELQARTQPGQNGGRLSEQEVQAVLPLVAKLSYCKQIADAIHQQLPSR